MSEVLFDEDERKVIRTDLDQNIMVLAGAGAGKTHEMVERMIALVQKGIPVEQIAAITFTRKAAGEMQERFFKRLQALAASSLNGSSENVKTALRQVDRCYIGTIHSFCGSILRERAFDAGLPPDFTEVQDRDEIRMRKRAWRRYVEKASPEALDALAEVDIRSNELISFFGKLSEMSDLELLNPVVSSPDLSSAVAAAQAFYQEYRSSIDGSGIDKCQKALLKAEQFTKVHAPFESVATQANYLKIFGDLNKISYTKWKDKDVSRRLRDEVIPHLMEGIDSALQDWDAYRWHVAATFVLPAVADYERQRVEDGTLTFQDLLVRARDLLKKHPLIREHFQKRYLRLFVDEFQDTDPIQAELLVFLTDTIRTGEEDWTKLTPDPGRLFVVGDGKQSIYRFRRADYETFGLVKKSMLESGRIVSLQQSFRTFENLCTWVNQGFPEIFQAHSDPHQADFEPLVYYVEKADVHEDPRIRTISIPKVDQNDSDAIVRHEASVIADFIAGMIHGDAGGIRETYAGTVLADRPSPGDFMILARKSKRLHLYAQALEARGIPYDVSGAGGLGRSEELKAVIDALETIFDPSNTVALVAYLRGLFAGISDAEIYEARATGVPLDYHNAPGNDLLSNQRILKAYDHLLTLERNLTRTTPSVALRTFFAETGLIETVAVNENGGSSRAGSLLKILAMVADLEAGGAGWLDVLDELCAIVRDPDYEVEETTLEAGAIDKNNHPLAVRIMTVHRAKGLEANVVFLVDPYDSRDKSTGRVDFHVSRVGQERPFVVLPITYPARDGTYDVARIEPYNWAKYHEAELPYAEAEHHRLLYVAATRAERLLVVSRYWDGREFKEGFWGDLHPALETAPELELVQPFKPVVNVPFVDPDSAARYRAEVREGQRTPTVLSSAVTRPDEEAMLGPVGGRGAKFGAAFHDLMERLVSGRLSMDRARPVAETIAHIHDLTDGDSVEAMLDAAGCFMESAFFRGLKEDSMLYTEVPLAVPSGSDGAVLSGRLDLIAQKRDGWHLVDYKTDTMVEDLPDEEILRRHTHQIQTYARVWETATGTKVVQATIWLAGPGRTVDVPLAPGMHA